MAQRYNICVTQRNTAQTILNRPNFAAIATVDFVSRTLGCCRLPEACCRNFTLLYILPQSRQRGAAMVLSSAVNCTRPPRHSKGPNMSDPNSTVPPSAPPPNAQAGGDSGQYRFADRRCRGSGRKVFLVFALIGSFILGGVTIGHLHAEGMEPFASWGHHGWRMGPPPGEQGDRMFDDRTGPEPGWGHHGWHMGPPPGSPADRVAFARYMFDRGLGEIGASADQKSQILAIFDAAAKELPPLETKGFTTRQEIISLLTAPTVDAGKLEALRAARIADADSLSKTVVDAVAKAAAILDADQRVKLAMLVDRFHHMPPPQ
eukprot:gene19407-19825_t